MEEVKEAVLEAQCRSIIKSPAESSRGLNQPEKSIQLPEAQKVVEHKVIKT